YASKRSARRGHGSRAEGGLPPPAILSVMAHGIHASPRDLGKGIPADGKSVDHAAILGAVREDVRQTLRSGWIDASIEVAAAQPVFFTAAWSAIRPNVGRS